MNDLIFMSKSELQAVIREELNSILNQPKPEPEKEPEKLYTTNEACEMLRCSKPTLHRWKTEGILPHVRIGSNIRYKETDITDLLNSKKRR